MTIDHEKYPAYGDPDFKFIDEEEKELIESWEAAEAAGLVRESTPEELEETRKMFKTAAKNWTKQQKDQKINLRLKQKDLLAVKRQAELEGLPYQTLISSLITKYVNGLLVQRPAQNPYA